MNSQDLEDIQNFDHTSFRNLISSNNSQESKVIQYIKSLGIHVNDQSRKDTIISDSSDYRNIHEFQAQV